MGQGTADYVIPPDRSRRQVLDDRAAADQQQQLQQGSVTGQQGGRGVRWWMRGMTSPSPATLGRSASAAAIHVILGVHRVLSWNCGCMSWGAVEMGCS